MSMETGQTSTLLTTEDTINNQLLGRSERIEGKSDSFEGFELSKESQKSEQRLKCSKNKSTRLLNQTPRQQGSQKLSTRTLMSMGVSQARVKS